MPFKKNSLALAAGLLLLAPSVHSQSTPAVNLAPVVISASRFADPEAEVPAGVLVITAEQIRESGAATANEALRRIAGIASRLNTTGGRDSTLDLRGFGESAGSNTVILVDGIRLNEGDMVAASTNWIPVESIERIEVMYGAGSVQYGEGAAAGTIHIITRQTAEGSTGYAFAGFGSHQTRDMRAGVSLAKDGLLIDANGYSYRSDNHRDNFRNRDEGASLRAQWSNDSVRAGIRVVASSNHSGLPGGLNVEQFRSNPRQALKQDDWAKSDTQLIGAFGEAKHGGWTVAFDLAERQKNSTADYRSLSWSTTDATSAMQASLRARHDLAIRGLHNAFVFGFDLNDWEKSRDEGSTVLRQRGRAWYARDTLDLTSIGTGVTAGIRSEASERNVGGAAVGQIDDRLTAWELGVTQSLGAQLNAFARVGNSYRLANADEYACYPYPGFDCPSFVSLQPQKSRDNEVGVRWNGTQASIQARAYRNDLANEIGTVDGWNNINFAPTRRQGFELDGKLDLPSNLMLRSQLAVRDAKFRAGESSGKQVPLVSRYTANVRLQWKPATNQIVEAGWQWASSQRIGDDWDNQCGERIPSNWNLDARYAYQWKNVELSLAASNLTDRSFYKLRTRCSAIAASIYPEPGRALMAGVRVRY